MKLVWFISGTLFGYLLGYTRGSTLVLEEWGDSIVNSALDARKKKS